MQPVYIDDPVWLVTLPHIVAPLPDEWFPGLLLRSDKVNGWESGATARYLVRMSTKIYAINDLSVSTPSGDVLERLSQLLAIPLNTAIATTYLVELARLTGISSQVFEERGRTVYWLFICPECVAQERLLRRTLALSHIRVCLEHYLMLQNACRCGAILKTFNRQAQPFTCSSCDLDWGKLPRIIAPTERITLEQKIQSYYAFLLSRVEPELLSSIRALIKECAKGQGKRYIPLPEAGEEPYDRLFLRIKHSPNYKDIVKRKYVSLGDIVYSLLDLGLSIDDIMTYAEHNQRESSND